MSVLQVYRLMKIENYIQLKHLAISLLVVISVTLLWLYLMNHISTNLLLFAEITTSLALITLLLPSSNDVGLFHVRLSVSPWILPVAVYVVAEAEILIFKHTGLGYVVALGLALLIKALSEGKPAKKVAIATAIVGASLIQLVPSFGNDTWRDILWATQALQTGHVTETAIRHSAYPFPMVPLEYSLVSLMSGLDPVWASVVMGLLYMVQLPLVVFLLSRRFGGFDDFRWAFVLLMAPLVVIWSAWYIPRRLKKFIDYIITEKHVITSVLSSTVEFAKRFPKLFSSIQTRLGGVIIRGYY